MSCKNFPLSLPYLYTFSCDFHLLCREAGRLWDFLWPISRVWQNWQFANSKSRPKEALLVLLEDFYLHVNKPGWENEIVWEGKTSCPSRGQLVTQPSITWRTQQRTAELLVWPTADHTRTTKNKTAGLSIHKQYEMLNVYVSEVLWLFAMQHVLAWDPCFWITEIELKVQKKILESSSCERNRREREILIKKNCSYHSADLSNPVLVLQCKWPGSGITTFPSHWLRLLESYSGLLGRY